MAFAGLLGILDDYRRVLSDARAGNGHANGQPPPELRQIEERICDCLRALGWRHRSENDAPVPGRIDPGRAPVTPADAARALAEELHHAEVDSEALLRRLQRGGGPRSADLAHAASRCHGLLQDALVIGAVELAVQLGVPDEQLPA